MTLTLSSVNFITDGIFGSSFNPHTPNKHTNSSCPRRPACQTTAHTDVMLQGNVCAHPLRLSAFIKFVFRRSISSAWGLKAPPSLSTGGIGFRAGQPGLGEDAPVPCCFPRCTKQVLLKAGTCLIQFNFPAAQSPVIPAGDKEVSPEVRTERAQGAARCCVGTGAARSCPEGQAGPLGKRDCRAKHQAGTLPLGPQRTGQQQAGSYLHTAEPRRELHLSQLDRVFAPPRSSAIAPLKSAFSPRKHTAACSSTSSRKHSAGLQGPKSSRLHGL